MAGAGYNIPISVSSAAGSSADGPFADDTYIVFSGSTLTSWQPQTNTPSTSTSATSAAAEGNAAAQSDTAASAASNPANSNVPAEVTNIAAGLTVGDYILLGTGAVLIFLTIHYKL